ncbi:MAG: nucleotidyl transferase AbiEii/AbiGii toxin family protein [Anaeromyxobacteraceae bacterium]
MQGSRLSATQVEVLRALAGTIPRWRLIGGAALAGFYTRHRETRDLDLLWEGSDLELVGAQVEQLLSRAGFKAEILHRAPAFRRYRLERGGEVVVLDLIAEPMPAIASPTEQLLGDDHILVDAPHEILVSKLTALLGRSELRDLEDVRVLVQMGGDLARALADAPRKDAGFSPLTLAWLLRDFPVEALGAMLRRSPAELEQLVRFRDELVGTIVAAAKPKGKGGEV